tara:strand:- start:4869 stop:5648 length:780 start_codon:yes stop_codon:yes gene_type:complete
MVITIEIEVSEFKDLIESVALKGKYNSGDTSKNGQLSNYAWLISDGEYLHAYNADTTTICAARVPNEGIATASWIVDIEKTVKYLKAFSGEVTLLVGDYLTITQSQTQIATAKVPLVSEHPHNDYIGRIVTFTNDMRSDSPSWGDELPIFGKTQFEAEIVISEDELARASSVCDVVNIARYKFNFDDEVLTMSSTKTMNETIDTNVEYTIAEGDSATVEFNGQFAKFLNGAVRLYLKDDAPVLFVTTNRLLLKAPYLNR